MKQTNKFNLPPILVAALARRDRVLDADHISVTQLLEPPRKRMLEIRHDAEIEEDISENAWMLLGQGVHRAVERTADRIGGYLAEQRMEATIPHTTMKLVGVADAIEQATGTLWDYKTVSAWSFVLGARADWERQLNLYAWLAAKNDLHVAQVAILAILRDWSERKAAEDKDYPQSPLHVKRIKLWSHSEQEAFLCTRFAMHQTAACLKDAALPECTPEERWERAGKWAVMKDGRKSSVRLCDSEQEAKAIVAATGADSGKYRVVRRPGESVRCDRYCAAAPWCNQYQRTKDPTADW